jgi:hypothetical protein
MATALPIPAELLELQRAEDAANEAIRQAVGRGGEWCRDRLAELHLLRERYMAAAEEVREHPAMRQARTEGRHHAMELALKAASREPEPAAA